MYQHILVPLDGSPLAEQVLSHATAIIADRRQDVQITLLRAVPPIYPVPMDYSGIFTTTTDIAPDFDEDARNYLTGIAGELRAEGFRVDTHVSQLPAAEAIVDYAGHHSVDLIIMATHGRSGIGRWVFGSVTQKVLHITPAPMLVVRPTAE
jgi:nucleotide-binding universal stress UspA family protein